MKIFSRYLAVNMLTSTLLALLVLTAVAGVFAFMGQLGDLAGSYGVLQALAYVLMTLPRRAYELFPTAVLLGALLGLGNLASNSELVVMRASGMSAMRITAAVLRAGLVLVVLATLIGEVLAPPGEEYAQNLRSTSRSGYVTLESRNGFWARDQSSFINIRRVLPGARLENISIYRYNRRGELQTVTHAASAEYVNGEWLLHNIEESHISDSGVKTQKEARARWDSVLDPGLLETLAIDPDNLAALSLYRYVKYLKQNNLDASRYQLAFWIKLITPLSTLVMLLVAMPFVFGPLRSSSAGPRVLIGVLVGLGFYLMNQALSYVGLVYGLDPLLSALLPSVLFAIGGGVALMRVH